MKKVFSIIALVLVLSLTGCGQSKIVCTSNSADSAFEANAKTTYVFDSKNKLKEIQISGKLLDDDSEIILKLAVAMGYFYDIKNDNGNVTGKVNIEKFKEEHNYTDADLKKDNIKKMLDADTTLTCK